MYCHWVMPFRKRPKSALVNHGTSPVPVTVGVAMPCPGSGPTASMHFHARWKIEYDVRTRPMQDWNYLTAKGKGVFGGVAFFIDNPGQGLVGRGRREDLCRRRDLPQPLRHGHGGLLRIRLVLPAAVHPCLS